jgi:hypothetical protein
MGKGFVPVGGLGDNRRGVSFTKILYRCLPAEKNYQLVKKDQIQVRTYGNSLFVGWTVPIQLLPPNYILPPACLLIEGYGTVNTKAYTVVDPSGNEYEIEQNWFNAYITFMEPAHRYSNPENVGFFIRDLVATVTPQARTVRA